MTFREKSAWLMMVLLVLASACYASLFQNASGDLGRTAPAATALPFVLAVILLSVVGQIVLALTSLGEAAAPADERERRAQHKAASLSGFVFAAGVVSALGYYLLRPDGDLLFHLVFASLIIAQLADYGLQIVFFRRGA
ncbi:MAG: hypothetical protein ACOY99_01370 [Pseudomonadota bacterium]